MTMSDGTVSTTATGGTVSKSLSENFTTGDASGTNIAQNQILVTNTDKEVTVNQNQTQLVITSSTSALSTITIPSTVTATPSIDYSMIKQTSGTTTSVQTSNSLSITKDSNGDTQSEVQVTIPANTKMSGDNWDGTCVIGCDNTCLVTKSTVGLPGSLKSITIGDQVYRVRYSGPDSSLERFSITSVDPILGQWKVELESQGVLVPQAHAISDVFLKVKYKDIDTSRITIPSK